MPMIRRVGYVTLLLLVAVANGCASAGASTGSSSNRDVLTAEEIAGINVANAYEAVERLRPRWLLIRAARSIVSQTEIVVFMNRSYLGGPEVLRQFAAKDIVRLRYLDGATAAASLNGLGGKAVEGAILIEVS